MAVMSITTTQNIELEYELASVGERIVACLIDLVIIATYYIATSAVLSISFDMNWMFVLVGLPVTFYSLLSEIFLNGQTVGKKIMGLKVISLSGYQPSFSQFIMRWFFRIVDIWISFFVVATVLVAVTQRQQRIGDLVAGTIIIRLRARTGIEQTLYVPVAETSYIVSYPEVINLHDRDMQLIKELMMNVRKSGNTVLAYQTVEKLESLLQVKNRYADPMQFLYVLLSDYNHLAAMEKK